MNEVAGLAEVLAKYGPWALVVIQGYAIRWLLLRNDAIQEKRVEEGIANGQTARACADSLKQVHGIAVAADAQLAAVNLRLQKYLKDGENA